jgi:serine/threonine-protein phosphatase CPPED1
MKSRPALLLSLFVLALIPCLAQEQPFYFMMLTDTQFGMYASDKGFAQETANYEFAVAAVNRLKPGFVIILGDLVNKTGDPEQIREYQRISRKIDPSIPVYHVAGNHDIGNEPTPDSLAAYRKTFGRDYYSFRAGPVYGIVLNSTLIHSPKSARSEYEEQDAWLKKELAAAKASQAQSILVFQHHPCFLKDAQEDDRYENIPRERRLPLLALFHEHGVRYVFAGHTHKNVASQDGQLQVVATGPVGKPLGQDGSGIRIAAVTGAGVEHRYYDFGALPDRLSIPRK